MITASGLAVAASFALAACGSTPTPVALGRCTAAQLTVSNGRGGAGLGHADIVVLFHDVGSAECTVQGFPVVALATAVGGTLVAPTRTLSGYMGGVNTASKSLPVVTIQPGGAASFMVEGTDMQLGLSPRDCPTYHALSVTAPSTALRKTLLAILPGCSRPEVHPVVPGVTGSDTT